MGLLPSLNIGNINISEVVGEFLDLLRGIDAKLGQLLEIEQQRDRDQKTRKGCASCDEMGRLRCPSHGPVVVPAHTSLDAD